MIILRSTDVTDLKNGDNGISVAKGVLGSSLIICIICGNLLLITAILSDRRLRQVKNNYFVVSLAVADLLLGLFVATFALYFEVTHDWVFGAEVCRLWISSDIMCCTASIVHLCVISINRYQQVKYALNNKAWMTTRKALVIIVCVWVTSALLSFLPVHLNWHLRSEVTTNGSEPEEDPHKCILELNFVYTLISSCISFYVPGVILLFFYFKLFWFVRKHAHSVGLTVRQSITTTTQSSSTVTPLTLDTKTALTLGVITGVFLVCWLPFFIINPIIAHNPSTVSNGVFVVFTWLGYANSVMNPIIYSIFNSEFRAAFKRILTCCKCQTNDINTRTTTKKDRDVFLHNAQIKPPEELAPGSRKPSLKKISDPFSHVVVTRPSSAEAIQQG